MGKEAEALYLTVVDQIVDIVWKKFPDNNTSRLYLYDRIGESFSAMARVLRDGTPDMIGTERPDDDGRELVRRLGLDNKSAEL